MAKQKNLFRLFYSSLRGRLREENNRDRENNEELYRLDRAWNELCDSLGSKEREDQYCKAAWYARAYIKNPPVMQAHERVKSHITYKEAVSLMGW